LRLDFDSEHREAALAALRGLVGPTLSWAGCVDCCLCEDSHIPGRIRLCMKWEDRRALEGFIRSPSYGRILALMELASQTPEVLFEAVTETQGMDYVADVRRR
jgi:quinol monooxygenase YgiN